jgi:hypothetical protein
MIAPADYATFLDREYLHGYVDRGGSAVKFAVAGEAAAAELRERVMATGRNAGYLAVGVDAASTRVQLMDEVFFEIARQVDWNGLAATTARAAASAAGYPVPEGLPLSLDAIAAHHGTDARELKRDLDRELQRRVIHDLAMVQEFRIAMLRLCQAQLQTGQVSEAEHAAILDWLHGDLRQMSALKSSSIYRRVARHNARQMLYSLPHWLAVNGSAGLLVVLDASRLGVARRPPLEERSGIYYTRLALLDAYEVMRQLVDSTDELSRCCIVVIAAPELITDESRGLDAYSALKLRIIDEVRDRRRDNPFSALVRIGTEGRAA